MKKAVDLFKSQQSDLLSALLFYRLSNRKYDNIEQAFVKATDSIKEENKLVTGDDLTEHHKFLLRLLEETNQIRNMHESPVLVDCFLTNVEQAFSPTEDVEQRLETQIFYFSQQIRFLVGIRNFDRALRH